MPVYVQYPAGVHRVQGKGAIEVRTARVVVALGSDQAASLDAAVGEQGGLPRVSSAGGRVAVLSATAGARAAAERLAAEIRSRAACGVRVVVPPSGLAAIVPTRRQPWTAVDVSGKGGRFARVLVPRSIVDAAAVCVVSAVVDRRDRGHDIAIGALARFAHPRHRLAVRAERGEGGLAADIALAFAPRLVVLVATVHGYEVAVSADDLIAAELVGLALRREQTRDDEAIGPWEDRLVQRATELDLGVRLPTGIDLVPVWAGPANAPGATAAAALTERIRLRLGIPAP